MASTDFTYKYGQRTCDYCGARKPITAIRVIYPAPHVSFDLCGRCYAVYHQGRLDYDPNSGVLSST